MLWKLGLYTKILLFVFSVSLYAMDGPTPGTSPTPTARTCAATLEGPVPAAAAARTLLREVAPSISVDVGASSSILDQLRKGQSVPAGDAFHRLAEARASEVGSRSHAVANAAWIWFNRLMFSIFGRSIQLTTASKEAIQNLITKTTGNPDELMSLISKERQLFLSSIKLSIDSELKVTRVLMEILFSLQAVQGEEHANLLANSEIFKAVSHYYDLLGEIRTLEKDRSERIKKGTPAAPAPATGSLDFLNLNAKIGELYRELRKTDKKIGDTLTKKALESREKKLKATPPPMGENLSVIRLEVEMIRKWLLLEHYKEESTHYLIGFYLYAFRMLNLRIILEGGLNGLQVPVDPDLLDGISDFIKENSEYLAQVLAPETMTALTSEDTSPSDRYGHLVEIATQWGDFWSQRIEVIADEIQFKFALKRLALAGALAIGKVFTFIRPREVGKNISRTMAWVKGWRDHDLSSVEAQYRQGQERSGGDAVAIEAAPPVDSRETAVVSAFNEIVLYVRSDGNISVEQPLDSVAFGDLMSTVDVYLSGLGKKPIPPTIANLFATRGAMDVYNWIQKAANPRGRRFNEGEPYSARVARAILEEQMRRQGTSSSLAELMAQLGLYAAILYESGAPLWNHLGTPAWQAIRGLFGH